MKLQGKIAVITGGNSGIGFGIAKEFEKEGAQGAIHGRNQEKLDRSQKELGASFIGIKGDVTNFTDLENLFKETSEKFGKIDILVISAGGGVGEGSLTPLDQMTEEAFDRMTDLNYKSAYFTVQKSLPYLNDGASIIFITSITSEMGAPGFSLYCAAKAALGSLVRSFSAELVGRGIRVNAISPGIIDTQALLTVGVPEEQVPHIQNMFIEKTPLGRMGKPSEIGKVATFLASNDSSFVIGEEINVDGGFMGVKQ
ncbi:MAG: SDR family oxidoreductase [Ectothiorhodospiraceae bacterium]|nr:SDR family oxidoreductase [Ectothiorhodospiraceae bacterium]